MLTNKDLVSLPSKDRFFALNAGQLLTAIKECDFRHSEYYKRIDIELRNPRSGHTIGEQIATFYPENAMIIYSFPNDFEVVRAKALLQAALKEFQRIDVEDSSSFSRRENTSYRINLGTNNQLIITRRVRSSTLAKYRGGAKFSNAFKPKKVDTSEEVLNVIVIT